MLDTHDLRDVHFLFIFKVLRFARTRFFCMSKLFYVNLVKIIINLNELRFFVSM